MLTCFSSILFGSRDAGLYTSRDDYDCVRRHHYNTHTESQSIHENSIHDSYTKCQTLLR
jgi:hypothetical protein